jgi:hypothetical protein
MAHFSHTNSIERGCRFGSKFLITLALTQLLGISGCEYQELEIEASDKQAALDLCRTRVDVYWALKARAYDVVILGVDVGDHIGGKLVREEHRVSVDENGELCDDTQVDIHHRKLYNHGSTTGDFGYLCPLDTFGCSYWEEPETDEEYDESWTCKSQDLCIDREVVDSYCDARCGNCDYDIPYLNDWNGHNSNNDFDAAMLAFRNCRTHPNFTHTACDECSAGPKFTSYFASDNLICRCETINDEDACEESQMYDDLHNYCDGCGGDTPCQQCADMTTCSQAASDGSNTCCGGIG